MKIAAFKKRLSVFAMLACLGFGAAQSAQAQS
jgi:hypothetical protein